MMWVLLGVVVVVITFLLLRARRGNSAAHTPAVEAPARAAAAGQRGGAKVRAPEKEPDLKDKFAGVVFLPQADACAQAKKIRGQTFAPDRVMQIPLPGCDRERCECKLNQVKGRRRSPRRVKADRREDVRFKEDRRKGKDRREGADAWNRGNA